MKDESEVIFSPEQLAASFTREDAINADREIAVERIAAARREIAIMEEFLAGVSAPPPARVFQQMPAYLL
jgi:hypothetical protein